MPLEMTCSTNRTDPRILQKLIHLCILNFHQDMVAADQMGLKQ